MRVWSRILDLHSNYEIAVGHSVVSVGSSGNISYGISDKKNTWSFKQPRFIKFRNIYSDKVDYPVYKTRGI